MKMLSAKTSDRPLNTPPTHVGALPESISLLSSDGTGGN
jgi:hypothetical protein